MSLSTITAEEFVTETRVNLDNLFGCLLNQTSQNDTIKFDENISDLDSVLEDEDSDLDNEDILEEKSGVHRIFNGFYEEKAEGRKAVRKEIQKIEKEKERLRANIQELKETGQAVKLSALYKSLNKKLKQADERIETLTRINKLEEFNEIDSKTKTKKENKEQNNVMLSYYVSLITLNLEKQNFDKVNKTLMEASDALDDKIKSQLPEMVNNKVLHLRLNIEQKSALSHISDMFAVQKNKSKLGPSI